MWRNTVDTIYLTSAHPYRYCELAIFADEAGHDVYQVHPLHLAFVEKCKHLWEKVVIFDSETI